MPVYEYYCPTCKDKFEMRRSIAEMDSPAVCGEGHTGSWRTLSMFSMLSKDEFGNYTSDIPMGGGGCACGGNCSCGA